ncbi:hypothetical protein BCCH1_77310 (plasmid) [Burkholderia contaminans]|uniref:Uncharacterized protein n=1 Tax=Burkholderia contaminans TaxID=488447 RepID=A0A250LKZ4_9BURK|nr:hypothetical protein BCCH1_77310 [Burkholderia contaminans]
MAGFSAGAIEPPSRVIGAIVLHLCFRGNLFRPAAWTARTAYEYVLYLANLAAETEVLRAHALPATLPREQSSWPMTTKGRLAREDRMGKHTIWKNIRSGAASEMTVQSARPITPFLGSRYRMISPTRRTKEKARRGIPLERGGTRRAGSSLMITGTMTVNRAGGSVRC